jgi:hypothetical protein
MDARHMVTITHRGDKAHADCACYWGTDLMEISQLHGTIMGHYIKIGYVRDAA